jgi:hypothetical protein
MAPARSASAAPSRRPTAPPAVITALVVADRIDEPLTDTLDALLGQSLRPDHVVVVDTSQDESVGAFVRDDPSTGPDGAAVEVVADPGADPRRAVTRAVLDDRIPSGATHLWFLTAHSAPAPDALRALASAVRSSPSAGLAGPKLVSWEDPSRLQAFGIQATRLGRLLPAPRAGVPDQGQHNHRTDTLAVPFEGLFVERDLFAALHGFEPIHGDLGGDLDLCWRAHQSGHRAVLAPAALVRVIPGGHGPPTPAQRRAARQVALTRCAGWSAPLLALWLVLTGVLAALGLLLLKRPRAAWQELSDVGGALTPWQAVSARWRSRGTRSVARRDLTGLYVTSGQVARAALDSLQDAVAPDADVDERVTSADDDEERAGPSPGPASALRHPGVLAVLATVAMTVVAARSIPGSMLERAESGLVGGELLGGRADSATLWHAWWDGWHGGGLGTDAPTPPSVGVLALATWLFEQIPGADTVASPAGATLAWLLLAALPVACVTAYTSARVITQSRWARALAAVAWVSTAVASTSVGGGRVGALAALVLLPPVAAGLVRLSRLSGTYTTAFATALVGTVLGAFVPGLLVLVMLVGLGVALLGHGGARLRGLVVLAVPPLLLGPWVVALATDPPRLLAGAGVAAWGPQTALPWELALAHPGGPGSYAVLASVPLVALGVLGLVRGRGRAALPNAAAATTVLGLAAALAAPHIVLGQVPSGRTGAGDPVTMWAGLGLLVYVLGLLAGALLGVDRLALSETSRWVLAARWPLVAAGVVGALGAAGLVAWTTFGTSVSGWTDPRPAVAVDQADGPLANRALLVDPSSDTVTYRLVGREVSGMVRGLPPPSPVADPRLSAAVGRLVTGEASGADPVGVLVSRAVGFVQVSSGAPPAVARHLDAADGLARIGPHGGSNVWRVEPLPAAGEAETSIAPSRLLLTTDGGAQSVDSTGENAGTDTGVDTAAAATLSVAEPAAWSDHATVRLDGTTVHAGTASGHPVYQVPAGTTRVEVEVPPAQPLWQRAQLVLLLVALFLSLPFGSRASRTVS